VARPPRPGAGPEGGDVAQVRRPELFISAPFQAKAGPSRYLLGRIAMLTLTLVFTALVVLWGGWSRRAGDDTPSEPA
jgi:hypothetical protein